MGLIIPEKYLKWQKREQNAEQTKSTAPFSRLLTLQAKDVQPGTYKLHWYYEIKVDAVSAATAVLRVVAKTNVVAYNQIENPQDDFESFGGWDFIQLGERETPEVYIEWRRIGGAGTVLHAQHVRLSIEFMESEVGPRGDGIGGGQPRAARRATQ